jgi:hypothetical protein
MTRLRGIMFCTMDRWDKWQKWIFWIGLTGVVASVILAFSTPGLAEPYNAKRTIKNVQAIVLCIWVFAPPVWFWYEYFFIYRKISDKEKDKPTFDQYKHGVDVASKLWLALVTVLLGLYFGKDFSREPLSPPSCTPQSSVAQPSQSSSQSAPSSGVTTSIPPTVKPH